MKVAYQGESGSFSEEAAERLFPESRLLSHPTIRRVFEAVETRAAEAGVVPIENSQGGSITETYDLFLKHGLNIVAETIIPVDHCLMALPGTAVVDIDEVFSHPAALAQCEEYLISIGVTIRADYDTAGAAKRIADGRLKHMGAVASARAAELYGLVILAKGIQTYPDNYTRFAAISPSPESQETPDKTSIVFGTSHVPGSLYRCIGAFAERGLSLSKLESRPRPGKPWEYAFYADLEAAGTSEMSEALAELTKHATFTRILGTYAAATLPQ